MPGHRVYPRTKAAGERVSPHRAKAGAHEGEPHKLTQRGDHWSSLGLSDAQVRHELQREGFELAAISKWLQTKNEPEDEDSNKGTAPDTEQPAPVAPAARTHTRKRRGGSTGGLLLALLVYPPALAYLTGGTEGLTGWFRAKFLNQTPTDPGIASSAVYVPGQVAAGAGASPVAFLGGAGTDPGPRFPTGHAGTGKGRGHGPKVGGPHWSAHPTPSHPADFQTVIAFAKRQIGKPYKWGGNGPDSWDCSGLIHAAYAATGVTIPRTTGLLMLTGMRTTKARLQPGDLVFPTPTHVQLYIGSGKVIEAPRTGLNVRIAPLGRVLMARRILL